jgi:hypothetical protein
MDDEELQKLMMHDDGLDMIYEDLLPFRGNEDGTLTEGTAEISVGSAEELKASGRVVMSDLLLNQELLREDFALAAVHLTELGMSPSAIHDMSDEMEYADADSRYMHGLMMSKAIEEMQEGSGSDPILDPDTFPRS